MPPLLTKGEAAKEQGEADTGDYTVDLKAHQVLLTEAWASAQVSALAPYSYSSLLWAVLFGWIGFGDVPSGWTVAGAATIVLASLYIMHRELLRGRSKKT